MDVPIFDLQTKQDQNKPPIDQDKFKHFLEGNLESLIKCPISNCVFFRPIVATDGFIYEGSVFDEYLKANYMLTSPMTRQSISTEKYKINLIEKIIEYSDNHNLEVTKEKYISNYSFEDNIDIILSSINNGEFEFVKKFKDFDLNKLINGLTFYELVLSLKISPDIAKSYNDCVLYILDNSNSFAINCPRGNILNLTFSKAAYYSIMTHVIDTLLEKGEDIEKLLYEQNDTGVSANTRIFTRVLLPIIDHLEKLEIEIVLDPTTIYNSFETLSESNLILYLKYVKNINETNSSGLNMVLLSIKTKKMLLFNELVKRDVNIRCRDADNRSILHYGCIYGDLEIVKTLIDIYEINKLDIDDESQDGWTALHYSCLYNKGDVIEYLIGKSINFQKSITKYNGSIVDYFAFNLIELNGKLNQEEKEIFIELFIQMMYF